VSDINLTLGHNKAMYKRIVNVVLGIIISTPVHRNCCQ